MSRWHSLTDSTLILHNCFNDSEDIKACPEPSELHRVETWITSLASTRSAADLKGWSSFTRSRATSVSSASSIAFTLATVNTKAESQVSEGFSCRRGGLEEKEKDEEYGYPSQGRNLPRKRAREMAEVRRQTLVHDIFISAVFFSSQELEDPLAFLLLPRSPASKAVSAGQSTPIQTSLVRPRYMPVRSSLFLITAKVVNGSRGRGGRSRDSRNGYLCASHQK